MNAKFIIAIFFTSLLLFSITAVMAADQIRPAPQSGSGEQIRPANQQNLPSDGNGNYQPAEGSGYSSSIYQAPPVVNDTQKMKAVLNSNFTNAASNANGTGDFVINKTSNRLSYNITYSNLSSNETGAEIIIPNLTMNNQTVSFPLALGNMKQGVVSFVEEVQSYILSGQALVKIRSLLFPDGEISGQIRVV